MYRFLMIAAIAGATLATATFAQVKQPPPGEGHRANPSEIPLLPKFCWSQYMDVKGPEYEIRGCGPYMNHYCWGLTELLRARKVFGNPQDKIGYLIRAKGSTESTLRDMKDYPACPIREHAETTLRTVNLQLRALGAK